MSLNKTVTYIVFGDEDEMQETLEHLDNDLQRLYEAHEDDLHAEALTMKVTAEVVPIEEAQFYSPVEDTNDGSA